MRGLKWLLGGGLECAPKSHPTGVRGLKYDGYSLLLMVAMVAPHWGAWIEIAGLTVSAKNGMVTPHWGAWIEMYTEYDDSQQRKVAPHWGAWIEILA